MVTDGYINGWDGEKLHGWAFDRAQPGEALEVEITLSNGSRVCVRANQFREDLLQNGIGNGCHGFSVALPATDWQGGRDVQLQVRVPRSGFELHGSPLSVPSILPLALIAGDVVNNCNLRCPFCMVDYSLIKGLNHMSPEVYAKVLTLAPHVPDGCLWLSCLHEPTLHPGLVDLIEATPDHLRKKLSFTSNFCKRLDDATLERLANSGMHSIRVSFDSMDPERFRLLRKGGRYEVFSDNLRRFADFLRRSSRAPELHLISMALRDNLHEVPDMVRQGVEQYGASLHEVRFMYYFPHIADWGKEHMLTLEQWQGLEAELKQQQLQPDVRFAPPEARFLEKFETHEGIEKYFPMEAPFGGTEDPMTVPLLSPEEAGRLAPDEAFRVRLRWDGMCMIEQIPEVKHRFHLPRLPDPAAYLLQMRLAASQKAHQEDRKSTN
jgi:molybdenum cofactor biosynthesis enzyme MoaA